MADPFLSAQQFSAMWDGPPLNAAQTQLVTLLLGVASKWITDRVADPDAATAQLVVFEVVSNTVRYGKYAPLSEYSRTTAHRMESGTLAAEVARYFTDDHKMLLGIPLRSAPMSSCRPNDFATEDCVGWPPSFSEPPWPYGF